MSGPLLYVIIKARSNLVNILYRTWNDPANTSPAAHQQHFVLCLRPRIQILIVFCTLVLRIRDVYPGSRIRIFSIPDPESATLFICIFFETVKTKKVY